MPHTTAVCMGAWVQEDCLALYVQHALLRRLAPLLEEPMHPRDCCSRPDWDKGDSVFSKPLPLSRRASAASHEDLHHLINQVCLCEGPPCVMVAVLKPLPCFGPD